MASLSNGDNQGDRMHPILMSIHASRVDIFQNHQKHITSLFLSSWICYVSRQQPNELYWSKYEHHISETVSKRSHTLDCISETTYIEVQEFIDNQTHHCLLLTDYFPMNNIIDYQILQCGYKQ